MIKFFRSVVLTFSLLSCNKSHSSLIDEITREGIYDNCVPFRGSVLRQLRGVQRKLLPAFTVFQMPSSQSEQFT